MSITGYTLEKPAGTFALRPDDAGAWRVYMGTDELGAYPDADTAARELAAGETCWLADGTDPGTLGLPSTLAAWTRMESSAGI